jgi:SAM-dependent methyltransferase
MTRTSGRQAPGRAADQVDTGHGRAELLRDADRPGAWVLLIDGVPQSHVDLDDPLYLDFEYVRRLGHVLDTAAPAGQPLRVLHLGAGALTLARYVAATRPGSRQLAAEIDAGLVDLVRASLPLPRDRGGRAARPVRVRVGDAREVLEHQPASSFDVVIADVFAGGRTPAHLTSAEFASAARRVLHGGGRSGADGGARADHGGQPGEPAGVFAANVADGPPLAHARAQVATARAAFPHVALIADPAVLRGRRFGNLVLAASAGPLPVDALTRRAASDPMPGRVLHGDELTRFTAGAHPVTDANASPSPAPPPGAFAY